MPYKKGDEPVPGFRMVKLLGRGGFGEVWKVVVPGGVHQALKVINLTSDQGYKEFRAIRLVKHIHHPNLVPTVGFWLKDEDGKLFDEAKSAESINLRGQAAELLIAMGLGDRNLFDRLRECQDQGKSGIPHEELFDYMEAAGKALDYLNQPIHDLGEGRIAIQHCDVKPQNILIVGGSAQVCDFGLARVLGGDNPHTQVGGTPFYTPPEVLSGNQPSKSSDQYSLAITHYHLLTGQLPFDAKVPTAAMLAHLYGNLDFAKVSEEEQAVLKRATALDPDKRYANCVELIRELRKAQEQAARPRKSMADLLVEIGMEIVPGYRIIKPIGKGGYGEVWEASAPGGKHVALKVIRNLECPKGLQEFKSLEVIKGVEHNYLIELHAYWLLDKNGDVIPDELRDRPDAPAPSALVIASRLAHKSLLDRLKECRKQGLPGIPAHELIHYMGQVAAAIDHLNTPQHPMGGELIAIQHRDIKPENILLARDNTVKLGDFGLAKVLEGSQAAIHGSSAGLTPSYAAPEMIAGTVTAWSDQYSLGITYYHLRTGTLPFEKGLSVSEVMQAHLNGWLELGLLPESEKAVIARATKVTPEERFPDCTAMVRALQKASGLPTNWEFEVPRPLSSSKDVMLNPTPTPTPPSGPKSQPRPTEKMRTPAPPDVPLPPAPAAPAEAPPRLVAQEGGYTGTLRTPMLEGQFLVPADLKPQSETDSELLHQETRAPDKVMPQPTADPTSGVPPPRRAPEAADLGELDASVKPTNIDLSRAAASPAKPRKTPVLGDGGQDYEEAAPPKKGPNPWQGKQRRAEAGPGVWDAVKKQLARPGVKRAAAALAAAMLIAFLALGSRQLLGARLKGRVRALTESGQFAEALDSVPAWYVSRADQDSLREQVRGEWIAAAKKLGEKKEYRQAFEAFQQILGRFADADTAKEFEPAKDALGRPHFQKLVQAGQFEDALTWVRETWGPKDKGGYEGAVKDAWFAYARGLQATDPVRARDQLDKYLGYFRGDAAGGKLRTEVHVAVVKRQVSKYVKEDRDFGSAFDVLKKNRDDLGGQYQGLEHEVLDSAVDLAKQYRDRQQKPKLRQLINVLRNNLPGNKQVEKISSYLPDVKGLQERLRQGEQKLLAKLPAEALPIFAEVEAKADDAILVASALVGSASAYAQKQPPDWDNVAAKLKKLAPAADLRNEDAAAAKRVLAQKQALETLAQFAKEQNASPEQQLARLAWWKDGKDQLPAWEKDQIGRQFQAVIPKLDLRRQEPKDAIANADIILAYDPEHFDTLLVKADKLRQNRSYSESLRALAVAEKSGEAAKARDRLDRLKVLVWAQSGQPPAFTDAAWRTVTDALKAQADWQPAEVKQVQKLRQDLGAKHVTDLLGAANQRFKARDYDKVAADLKGADTFKEFARPEDWRQAEALQALAVLKGAAGDRQAAAAKARELAKGDVTGRTVDLLVAYGNEALKSGGFPPDEARQTLDQALSHVPGDRQREVQDLIQQLANAVKKEGDTRLGQALAAFENKLVQKQLTAGDLAAVEKGLAAVPQADLSADDKGRVSVLQALAWARDPAKTGEAAKRLAQLFTGANVPRPDLACQAYIELVKRAPKYFPEASAAVTKAARSSNTAVSQTAKGYLRDLTTEQVKASLFAGKGNWEEIESLCRAANATDEWVRAAQLEARVEKGMGQLRSEDLDAAAKEAAGLKGTDAQAQGYIDYVRGLVGGEQGATAPDLMAKAADRLVQAFGKDSASPALAVEARRRRAAGILQKAAVQFRAAGDSANPFLPAFQEQSKEAAAAYRWLKQAVALVGSDAADPALKMNLALAGWFKPEPDKEAVLRVSVPTDPAGPVSADQLLCLRLKAQALEETGAGKADAFAAYADLARLAFSYQRQADAEISPTVFVDTVIDRGIQVGKQLGISGGTDGALKRQLESLYASKGRIIGKSPSDFNPGPYQKLFDAYDAAYALSPERAKERAEYIVQRDVARMWLGKGTLTEYESDANLALEHDDKYAGAHLLLGIIRSAEGKSARSQSPGRAIQKYEAAHEEFTKGIELLIASKDPYKERWAYYLFRMNSAVALANAPRVKGDRRRALLLEASEDAQKALNLKPPKNERDKFNAGRGNALEDLAMLVEPKADQRLNLYEKALVAHEGALRDRPTKAKYWISLARCKYRTRVLTAAEPRSKHTRYLTDAEEYLKKVIKAQGFEAEPTPAETLEANYWLAKVYVLQKRIPLAEDALRAAIELKDRIAEQDRPWLYFALEDAADLKLDQAKRRNDPDDTRTKDLLQAAAAYADELASARPTQAARVRGDVLRVSGKPVPAFEAYKAALPDRVPEYLPDELLRLYLAKFDLLADENHKVTIRTDKGIDPKDVANEADAVAGLLGDDSPYLGQADALAGFAHLELIPATEDDPKERAKAYNLLRKARERTSAEQEIGWRTRVELARQAKFYMEKDEDKKEDYRRDGIRFLQEALKTKLPKAKRDEIQNLLTEISKKK
jgi:serine/threonine protein kinase